LPLNDKLTAEDQEIRILKKKLKDAELENGILKKGGSHLFQGRLRKYEFIKSHMNLFAVEKLCKIINTSSSSFYKWISRPKSNRDKKTEELSLLVKQAYQDSDQIYGSPRIP